jgi:HK97 gp10 family phage protein
MAGTVTIDGLKEFNKALRTVDKSAPKMTKQALNECSDFLISKTKPLIPVRKGNARASLKKRSSQSQVKIVVGGARARYYPWLDFGGRVGRKKKTVRRFIQSGRYLYPTLAKNQKQFVRIAQEGLAKVAKDAGLDVEVG